MKDFSGNTAILIFVRSLKEELETKKLVKNDFKKNVLLFKNLNRKAQKNAEETNLPVFLIDSFKQKGDTFSQRFKNAYIDVFSKGFDKVISIGNDVPALTQKDLYSLCKQLQSKEVVFGETKNRGVYALGLTKNAFEKVSFHELKWQTKEFVSSLEKEIKLKQLHSYKSVSILNDINTANELKRVLKELLAKKKILITILLLLLPKVKVFNCYNFAIRLNLNIRNIFFRGPPSYLRYCIA